jgi:phosphoglycolate phosphatase-like HAD superfamily hydrolase
LIENGGVSKATYRRAFEMVTGSQPEQPVETDGRTDPLIMRSLFERHGLQPTDELLAQALSALPQALSSLLQDLRDVGYALPGAHSALAALREEPAIVQTAVTGNIDPNARMKLAAFGLDRYLDLSVGGYGSDSETRSRLVTVARDRAIAKYKLPFTDATTIVIGDTERDIEAGHGGGAYVIGVATGSVTPGGLRAAGADDVLDDLVDTARVIDAVRAVRRRVERRDHDASGNG